MNKITKLLFAFVAVASFSLTSCEPDYVTDGSTVPSEAHITISYLDSEGNVTSTEEYSYDKTNSQVSGVRGPRQDVDGVSYTESTIVAAPNPENLDLPAFTIFFEYQEETGIYQIKENGRNTAMISIDGINDIYTSTDEGGQLEVFNYNILTGSSVADMYFRSRSEFSFYAKNPVTNQTCRVQGTVTTNFKL